MPGLKRVEFELRANGVRKTPNPLRAGIHTRGYLPHVKREGAAYFVTFRLADSLPREVLAQYQQRRGEQFRRLTAPNTAARQEIDRDYQRQIERYLDIGAGECYLRRPEVADIVAQALLFFNLKHYLLEEWVIMPNHVHFILWPMPNHTLSAILQSRKRQTARQANLILGRTGESFWQPESYDHWIRNDDEKSRVRRYIRNNPVTAGLCATPEDWLWNSANPRWTRAG